MTVADLPGPERLVVETAALSGAALPLGVVASLLGTTEDEALAVGERLAQRGLLRDTPAGFITPGAEITMGIIETIGGTRRRDRFGRLADAFLATPAVAGSPELGRLLLEAGRYDEALPRLAEVGTALLAEGEPSDALPYLDGAIRSHAETGGDDDLEGRLHLTRAQAYRSLGRSDLASADADVATRRLTGSEKVDAYGWAASLADDRQRAHEAERLLASGEYVAAEIGELGKQGSLLTLRARVLGRLGFGDEAEAAAERGRAMLETHGTPDQRTWALYNRAWIAFDQGRMRLAEAYFGDLATRFADEDIESAIADARAWRARALMYSGRPDQGLTEAAAATDLAVEGGEIGALFLAAMARASGAALHGAGEEALHAADQVLALVLRDLPQWENGARFLRAQALLAKGDLEEAAEEIDRAILACPEGIDGESWRLRCRSLALRISSASGEPWPADVADEVTEACLTARWHLPAAQLLAVRARREKDPELARQGAALAVQLGIPMVAARNVEAAGLWDEVTGTAVAAEVRSLGRHVPEEWRERWEALPEVAAALATPEASPADAEEAAAELQESLQRVFQEVGLAGADHVLSPAQRRAAGITIRRRRRRPLWQVLTFAGAIVAVGAVAAVALTLALQPSEGTTTIIEQPGPTVVLTLPPTTTLPPEPVEIQLPRPETPLTTQWAFGGERPFDAGERGLTGVADVSGVREAAGYYWRVDTNDPIPATIVGRGRNLFVGNLSGSFFIYETNGRLHRTLSPDTNRGFTTAATAELVGAMGTTESGSRLDIVLFGDTEGRLHAADGGDGFELPRAEWDAVTGGAISTVPLVVGDLALVGSRDGYVHAFSLSDGGELRWRFPADDMDIEPSTPVDGLALMDGVVYVVREDQSLYGLDPETGLLASNGSGPLCAVPSPDLNGTPLVYPVAVDGYVYVSAGPFVYRFNAANCGVPTTVAFHGGEASAAPAVDIENGVLWQPIGFFVLRFDISMGLFPADYTCSYPLEGGRVRIRSAPAVARPEGADPIVYFGDDAGTLHAIDGETCDLLWSWQTGGSIISSPALGDRVVFVTSEDGTITAIGPAPGGE